MKRYQRLKDLREDRDMGQKEVAAIIQTTQRQYSRWERGEAEMPFHHIITLAKFYDCNIDYIAGLTNIRKPTYPRK